MKICLFGASSNDLDKNYYEDAFQLGKLIALGGHSLIYGGSERGIMKACADGVLSLQGEVIGVAPRFFDEAKVLSRNCKEIVLTDSMSERKKVMEDLSEAFIVLPGGVGTFDELFETLTLRQLNVHNKPIALLNTSNYFYEFDLLMKASYQKKFLGDSCLRLYQLCSTPEEAIQYITDSNSSLIEGRGLNY